MMRITVQPTLDRTIPAFDPDAGRPLTARWQTVTDRADVPAWARTPLAQLAAAATRAGIGPDELAAERYPGSALARLAKLRGWAPATVCLYAKAAWAHGVDLPRLPTPEPAAGPTRFPELLTAGPGDPPTVLRAAVWCQLASVAPAELYIYSQLATRQCELTGEDVRLHLGPRPITIPNVRTLLARWLEWRAHLPGWSLLATLQPGPGSRAGDPVSVRGLQAAFRHHALRAATIAAETAAANSDVRAAERATAYVTLTYDTFRRLRLAHSSTPAGVRGLTRARR